MKTKQIKVLAVAIAASMMLAGCGEMTIGMSGENEDKKSAEVVIGQSQDEPVKDSQRFHTELEGQGVFVRRWQEWDRENLPAQYLMEIDDTALMLIEQVQNISLGAEPVRLFDGVEHARTSDLLRIALKNSPAIDFDMKIERDEKGRTTAGSGQYPNHVLTALLQNEQEEGRDLREFYYQEDVAAVYRQLFGDGRTLNFQDICPQYYYYAREGVFAHKGEKSVVSVWPMMVGYDESEDAITADLILTENSDPAKPLIYNKEDGSIVELTAGNYKEELAGEPVYRYTFKKVSDERITLDGIRRIGVMDESGTKVVDAQLLVEDNQLEIAPPEKLMVSTGSAQSRIDLQKEYEDSTISEYLLELLGGAEQVDSSLANQVLTASESETVTLTFGYTEGREMVLNVLSQGYLPGIERSFVTFSAGAEQYILPQEDYELISACLTAGKAE